MTFACANPVSEYHPTNWGLSHYKLDGKTNFICGIEYNLTGIAFHPPSGWFYAISNKLREIPVFTHGSDSISDVFNIAGEHGQNIVKIEILEGVDIVFYEDSTHYHLAINARDNKGIEAVA